LAVRDEDDDRRAAPIMRRRTMTTESSLGVASSELGRLLLYLALLWPLLFLFVPPRVSSSRMALLSAGMDVVDPGSLSRHLLGEGGKKMTAKDRIDDLRRIVSGKVKAEERILRDGMRSLLGRTDAVGYGPSMPRFAAVVVVPPPSSSEGGSDDVDEEQERRLLDGAAKAVESIFRTSDRNRVFVVAVVMDGREGGDVKTTPAAAGVVGKEFEARLRDVDSGRTAHRHGNRVHVHHDNEEEEGVEEEDGSLEKEEEEEEEEEAEEHSHSTKVHVVYNRNGLGVSASRDAGTRFVNALVREHEGAGLKSAEEELILLFLRCDSTLRESPPMGVGLGEEDGGGGVVGRRTWLDDVTDALIPTPDDYSATNDAAAATAPGGVAEVRMSPPANAVSFVVDHSAVDESTGNVVVRPSNLGATFSFDRSLRIVRSHASGQDMALSDGASYPAPLSTAATAMRLNTYNALPAPCDAMLPNHHAADVQLSLNLWMCADGIDVLGGGMARVVVDPMVLGESDRGELSGPLAARKFIYLRKCGGGDTALKIGMSHMLYSFFFFLFRTKKVSSARGCRATRTRPTPMGYCTPSHRRRRRRGGRRGGWRQHVVGRRTIERCRIKRAR
jgi:hypothetical protein